MFRFRNDDFNRVGCGTINGTNFLTLADCIEDIDRESVLKDDEKGVTRSHIADVVRRRLNKLLIISLASHQAWAGGFIKGNSELDAGDRSDQNLIKVFDGLDKMTLSQNNVATFWNRESNGFQFQGDILSDEDIGYQFTGNVSQAEMPSLELIGQFFMIDAETMKERGLQVMDVDRIFYNIVAVVVGLAINDPSLHAASSQPHRKATRMMISSIIGLR